MKLKNNSTDTHACKTCSKLKYALAYRQVASVRSVTGAYSQFAAINAKLKCFTPSVKYIHPHALKANVKQGIKFWVMLKETISLDFNPINQMS